MPSISNGQIIWDYNDWTAGLNEQYVSGLSDVPIPIAGSGFSAASRFNPFRSYGYASPGFNPTNLTNVSVLTDLLVGVTVSTESGVNYGYAISQGDKLHRIDIANKEISNAGSWPRTIVGVGAITGNDVIAYTANVGGVATPCVFYSWNDSGGAWNIGRFRTDTGAFDDDFMSTVPATPLTPSGNNKPHAMYIGANDIMYIWDGNKIHAYDGATGADGTCSTGVLTLPQGYIGTAFAAYDGGTPYLACFAYYSPAGNSVQTNVTASTQAMCFFYDYFSLDPTRAIPLNDRAVTSAFNWKGTIGCFTVGNNLTNDSENRYARLKIFNGVEFETATPFIGNAPRWGGIDIVGDSIQWTDGGNLFSYGAPFPGMPQKLNKIGGGGGTSNGILRTLGGITGFQAIGTGTTTSGGLQYMQTATFDHNASFSSNPAFPSFKWGFEGAVQRVRVEFARETSGGHGITVFLVNDSSGTSQIISNLQTITSANSALEYEATTSGGSLPSFTELRVGWSYTAGAANTAAPVVKKVVVTYYEQGITGN